MTITEAFETIRASNKDSEPFSLALACGFTPLHLRTFLEAHIQQWMEGRRVDIETGTFGNVLGTIEQPLSDSVQGLAIALEWPDFDTRFSYREAGIWGTELERDLEPCIRRKLNRLETAITHAAERVRVALSLPTLPLPPAFHPPCWRASHAEMILAREMLKFAERLVRAGTVGLVNPSWIDQRSPMSSRLDLKSELLLGFPYTNVHADVLAAAYSRILVPKQPMKGVITDLDDTLWSGLVGEVGPAGVRWDAASRHHLHGLYQKLLRALSEEGVLIAVASRNDPATVAEAFRRQDLLLPPERIFPIEVGWSPKSESVTRILNAWNISADAVVFVDDTPLELAEVANAQPDITCLRYPSGDFNAVLGLLKQLRELCGKAALTEDDSLRLESIRKASTLRQAAQNASTADEFLGEIDACVTFDFDVDPLNPRVLELIQKTNQFNLNGARPTTAEWRNSIMRPGAFFAAIKYEDKFGPLGTIAVIHGCETDTALQIETWVMSCRAFARRIEYQCVKKLFERFQVSKISFRFAVTGKNGPLRTFFATILGATPDSPFTLTKKEFWAHCPPLYHRVQESNGALLNA